MAAIVCFVILVLVEVWTLAGFVYGYVPENAQDIGLFIVGTMISIGVGVVAEWLWHRQFGP